MFIVLVFVEWGKIGQQVNKNKRLNPNAWWKLTENAENNSNNMMAHPRTVL